MADRDKQGGEQGPDGAEASAQRGTDFDTLRETLEAILASMRLSPAEKMRS